MTTNAKAVELSNTTGYTYKTWVTALDTLGPRTEALPEVLKLVGRGFTPSHAVATILDLIR